MLTKVLAVYSTVLTTRLAAFTLAVFRFSTRTVKLTVTTATSTSPLAFKIAVLHISAHLGDEYEERTTPGTGLAARYRPARRAGDAVAGSHVSILRAVVRRPRHPRAVLALYGERFLNRDEGGPLAKEKEECCLGASLRLSSRSNRRAGGSSEERV